MDSTVTSAALNSAVGSNVTAINSSTGGAVLLNSTQLTDDVDNNTVVLSGVLWLLYCVCSSHDIGHRIQLVLQHGVGCLACMMCFTDCGHVVEALQDHLVAIVTC